MSLVDQYGYSVSSNRVYRTPTSVRTEDRPRPRPRLQPEMARNVSAYDRRELIDAARTLKALPLLQGAIRQKAMWACGDWGVKYIGANKKWGEEMTDDLNNIGFKFCTPNFENFSFQQMLKVTSEAQDTDGAQLNVWIRTGAGQFPQQKIIEATMISTDAPRSMSGYASYATATGAGLPYQTVGGNVYVKGGAFDGARIQDGVVFDRDNRRLACRVWGYDDVGNITFADVPAQFSQLLFEPSWANGVIGIPRMAAALVDLMRIGDINDWLTTAIGIAARLAITRKTHGGDPGGAERTEYDIPSPGLEGTPSALTTPAQTTYERIGSGIYELDAQGEEISQVPFNRPSMEEEKFINRINSEALWSIAMPIQLFDPAAMGRAGARSVKEIFRMGIWERQQTLERQTLGYVNWYVAKRMANGSVTRNDDAGGRDAFMWRVELPAEYTVDEGNDRAADLNDIKMGAKSRTRVLAKYGEDFETVDAEIFEETRVRAAKAAKLAAEFKEKDFNQWLDFLEQRGPNPIAIQKVSAPAPAPKPAATANPTFERELSQLRNLISDQGGQKPMNIDLKVDLGKPREMKIIRDEKGRVIGAKEVR